MLKELSCKSLWWRVWTGLGLVILLFIIEHGSWLSLKLLRWPESSLSWTTIIYICFSLMLRVLLLLLAVIYITCICQTRSYHTEFKKGKGYICIFTLRSGQHWAHRFPKIQTWNRPNLSEATSSVAAQIDCLSETFSKHVYESYENCLGVWVIFHPQIKLMIYRLKKIKPIFRS